MHVFTPKCVLSFSIEGCICIDLIFWHISSFFVPPVYLSLTWLPKCTDNNTWNSWKCWIWAQPNIMLHSLSMLFKISVVADKKHHNFVHMILQKEEEHFIFSLCIDQWSTKLHDLCNYPLTMMELLHCTTDWCNRELQWLSWIWVWAQAKSLIVLFYILHLLQHLSWHGIQESSFSISQLGMVHVDSHENPRLECIETVYTCKRGVVQKA